MPLRATPARLSSPPREMKGVWLCAVHAVALGMVRGGSVDGVDQLMGPAP